MLQNHYGDHEFPVRPRARHARRLQQAHTAAPLSNRTAAHRLRRAAPALALWTALLLAQDLLRPLLPAELRPAYLVLATLTLLPVVIATVLVEGFSYRRVPLREQRRYRELTGAPDLSARQQQLLALDAQSDYAIGAWNSSLEYAPSWRCLPEHVRRAWEPGTSAPFGSDRHGQADEVGRAPKGGQKLFETLPMTSVTAQRADIDERYHLASGHDVRLYIADLLNQNRPGGISARFASAAAGPDGDRMIARVASLTGRDEFALRALTEPVGGARPELLGGADVAWAISRVRLCYGAEHLDAQTAWELIERAGVVAGARFDSWQEYWDSVRTGVAFGSDSLDAVQRFDAVLAQLRASEWPAARVPWLSGVGPVGLDQADRGGYGGTAGPEAAGGIRHSAQG